jgi:methyl-accepting chemotaxis protein
MTRSLNASHKILLAFFSIAALAAAAGSMIIWATLSLARSGEFVGGHLAPLVDASMEIKLSGAEAHLLMEEIMAGDAAEDVADVHAALAQARFYANAILNGGENDEGIFQPTTSPDVRREVEQVLEGLAEFDRAVDSRFELLSQSTGVGTDVEGQFDDLYEDLVLRIGTATAASLSPDVQRLAGEARYRLAHGHLLVAEIIGGDKTEDFGEATGSFEAAASRLEEAASLAPALVPELGAIVPDVIRLKDFAVQRYDRAVELDALAERTEVAFDAVYDQFISSADAAETLSQDAMRAGLVEQSLTSRRAVLTALAMGVAMLVLLFGFHRWLDRTIGARMKALAAATERLTGGDLEVSVPDWQTDDEVGLLRLKLEDLRLAFRRQKELEVVVSQEREVARSRQAEAEAMQAKAEEQRKAAELLRTAAEARSEATLRFGAEFSRVVEAARAGRFGERIEKSTGQPDLDALGASLNEMLVSMEAGVRAAINVMSSVAKGDLSKKMEGRFDGAFADMQASMNTTLDELTRITSAISDVSRELTGEVVSLAQSSDRLSQRSTSQAASLEETNAAIVNMSSMVKSTETDCAAAVEQVRTASQRAQSGEDVVLMAIAAVEKIDENARKVSEFIKVIDEISFQTNLLALNAGVEAARAGEAGKGFAVVAQEVRALAQRANEAASGIGRLIDESGRGVAEGVRLVTQTGEVLREILGAITHVASFSERIAESSREQSNGIAEVSTVIADLDRLTQQNATMAEDGTSLSRKLQDRAQSMEMLIDFFKIAQDGGRSSARAAV